MDQHARAFINDLGRYQAKAAKIFTGPTAQQAGMYIERFERAERLMTDLAARTGGRIFSPLQDREMKDVYGQVARELKNQYIITYIPKNLEHDGRLRHVKVFLARPRLFGADARLLIRPRKKLRGNPP